MALSRRSLLVGLPAAAACGPAGACGFDGVFDAGFGPVHPRAIEVALAIRQAVEDGLLPPAALAPITPGEAGLWQAITLLKQLGRSIAAARVKGISSPSLALLCANASLWTRYVAAAPSFETLVHVTGPAPLDAVIVSDLAVVTALMEAGLSPATALGRGLLVIEPHENTDDTTELLVSALDSPPAASGVADRTAWSSSRRH
jgi:hypothetical protein